MVDVTKPIYGEIWANSGEKLSPGTDKIATGWIQEMMPYQYENFLQNRTDVAISYLLQKGIPEWSADQEYIANKSVVTYSGQLYLATATSTNVLPTVVASWKRLTISFGANGAVPISFGGTGATTAADARTNLGIGSAATVDLPTTNGIVTKLANNSLVARTITGTSGYITVTNGDGVSGNPTINVGANVAKTDADAAWSTKTSIKIPSGTSSERGVGAPGRIRFNMESGVYEGYDNTGWNPIGSTGTLDVQNFSGDGVKTSFTMSATPRAENNTQVYFNGVYQQKNSYNLVGNDLVFDEAPALGIEIEVVTVSSVAIGTTTAAQTSIVDSGNYYNSTNVEGALQQVGGTLNKAILSYPDYASASAAATTLPDEQVVEAEGYEYSVTSGALAPERPAASVSDVDTIAELRALPAPKKKCVIYVRGYYAANDGGGGYFQWVPASSKPDNGGNVISPSGSPSNGRWEWGGEIVGKRFGIRADGITDDASRMQAAIDAASAGPGLVLLPEGFIYKPATTGPVLPKNGVTLRGMGRGKTILKHDDTTGSFRYLGTTSPAGACASFVMEDLTVEGMWSTSLNSNGTQMIELWYIDDLRLNNVGARNSRAMGITGRYCKKVSITKCDIYRTNGDGIAFWDCDIIDVSNNTLEDCNDDCISLHTNDATASPLRQQVTVLGNRIRTSQGIKVLGAKNVVIGYNSMSRMYAYAFYVNSDSFFNQGDTPNHSFSIVGNVVNDVFRRVQGGAGDQYYIRFGGGQRNAGSLAAAPGMPDTSTGSIVSLFGTGIGSFQAQNTDDTSVASPGGFFINVSGNTFARTLPAVASVDQWGFGQLFSADHEAGFYNGPITEADLQTEAIVLDPYINSALIENNIVATTGNALRFNIASVVDMAYVDVMIRGNKFRDFKDYGVRWPLGTFTTQRISIHGNEFDADPRLVHANRGANGTWAMSGLPSCVYAAVVGGLDIRRNGFRNTCQPVTVGGSAVVNMEANLLFCDPAAIGFNTLNKGIGVTPRAGSQYQYVMEGSDPASATFGKLLNATLLDSNSLPTTGKYMPGHIVRNTNPSVAGSSGSQYIITGWLRTSLGSGHVLNTDWRELRSLTGT